MILCIVSYSEKHLDVFLKRVPSSAMGPNVFRPRESAFVLTENMAKFVMVGPRMEPLFMFAHVTQYQ